MQMRTRTSGPGLQNYGHGHTRERGYIRTYKTSLTVSDTVRFTPAFFFLVSLDKWYSFCFLHFLFQFSTRSTSSPTMLIYVIWIPDIWRVRYGRRLIVRWLNVRTHTVQLDNVEVFDGGKLELDGLAIRSVRFLICLRNCYGYRNFENGNDFHFETIRCSLFPVIQRRLINFPWTTVNWRIITWELEDSWWKHEI